MIVILILSAIIIVFVLYLLVRTMLNNKQMDYGILKSLGFTTGQLILQTAMSFMPVVFKNKENCTESIAFRRIKRGIGDLASVC